MTTRSLSDIVAPMRLRLVVDVKEQAINFMVNQIATSETMKAGRRVTQKEVVLTALVDKYAKDYPQIVDIVKQELDS